MNRKPITSRLTSFRIHCDKLGIKLLRDDLVFIDDMLDQIDKNEFKAVLSSYAEKWLHQVKKSENEALSQNLGRKIANSWLREQADECRRKKAN